MKLAILFAGLMLSSILASGQQTEVIALKISTPQPRLNESFEVSLDITSLQASIFQSLASKLEMVEDFTNNEGDLKMTVYATKKGKQEIGPLEFYLNNTKYVTNKINYEVVDALPKTNEGLWIRKVKTSDSTFCILFDQRIPATTKITPTGENSTSVTTEPDHEELAKFKDTYSIEGLSSNGSRSSSSFSMVKIKGEDKEFMYGFSVYNFIITDKTISIKITKDKLEHIPAYYKFEDIIIQ